VFFSLNFLPERQFKSSTFVSDYEELGKSQAVLLVYLANAGCLRQMQSIRDRDLLVPDIVMFQVIHRVQGPFHRFCEGLTTLGVLQKIRSHPDSFRPLFCYQPCVMTADQMENLFSIRLSQEGSNQRELLRKQLSHSGETFSWMLKVLALTTGASVVPAIGFSPTPSKLPLHTSYQLSGRRKNYLLKNVLTKQKQMFPNDSSHHFFFFDFLI
uniref:Uncharacterized protein n=1 Tax=Oryzias latipes TaxID=8090 RepID=A0A3P9HAN3_ORYLA